ncbi:myrosinase 1-like [Linepithema humile]|uniref:myrosinase 1-like n=1 Tax=Linepithema humile TaxID=83485 RepID=UPI000623896E|nr:PREDICTED: myrosinase 1-like [Linepithema humile]
MTSYSFLRAAFSVIFAVTYVFANDTLSFPQGFLLGTATSAYQIEGGWNINGKGESVWDRWTHDNPNLILDHSNGDVACDSYHKYKEDVQLLKDMEVDFYRFSVSWTRILPTGYPNVINQDGINYYKNLINELLANNIEPFITLYHWDHPEYLDKMGGWTNSLMVEWISNYARVVFKELGPKVKYFTTINEPADVCQGVATDKVAPGKNLGSPGKYLCMHNILKAHAKIYHIYQTEFRKQQKGQVGIVISCPGAFPKTPNDTAAVDAIFQFVCGWVAHPIFSKTGDYPEIIKAHIADNSKLDGYPASLLPTFSPKWVQYIKGSADFFGLNHYTSKLVETVPRVEGERWYDYSGVKQTIDPSWPKSAADWLRVVPDGLRQVINLISKQYDRPPIFVMENGFADECCTSDSSRISYLRSYMKAMLSAIYEDGCNVKSYTAWSLLDNFEWADGYKVRFGLVNVDFTNPNRTRTPKLSMNWYKTVIKTRRIDSIFESPDVVNIP